MTVSRKRLAPVLSEVVAELKGHPMYLKKDHPRAAAELRALLAVARAAEREHERSPRPAPPTGCRLCAALARLRRLSEGR